MAFCTRCGTQVPGQYSQCPNCGAPVVQTQQTMAPPQQPFYNNMPAAMPQPYIMEAPITSTGAWFGWYLLCCVLPIIGTIIMLCATPDPSAKNYAKVMLIIQCVIIALYTALIIFGFSVLRRL